MIDLNELERLAKEATPGPWKHETPIGSIFEPATSDGACITANRAIAVTNWGCACCVETTTKTQVKDAACIAAVNPSVVLELIERLRAAENFVKAAKELESNARCYNACFSEEGMIKPFRNLQDALIAYDAVVKNENAC